LLLQIPPEAGTSRRRHTVDQGQVTLSTRDDCLTCRDYNSGGLALTKAVFVFVGQEADALAVLSTPSPPLNEERATRRFSMKKSSPV
jgi:hypothetical protein